MFIQQLHIENFRNLVAQVIPFSPSINLITGENGAGKTALLEAIFFLSRQRSFRSNKPKDLLQNEKDYFRLIAKTQQPNHLIGLERRLENKQLNPILRIDKQAEKSPARLARLLPVVAMTAKSFQLIDAGPEHRRQFMDYATFHRDEYFHHHWLTYQRALKNRNALLKKPYDLTTQQNLIASFNAPLAQAGEAIHQARLAFFTDFKPLLLKHLAALNFPLPIEMQYHAGWQTQTPLLDVLNTQLAQDLRLKYTRFGPHRSDLYFQVLDGNAENRLSRGQQKTLILALYLAQIDFLHQYASSLPMLIFDDIAAELDKSRRNAVFAYLLALNCQMFFSATEIDFFEHSITQQAAHLPLIAGRVG